MDSDDTLLLKADGFESYGTACEFVQVLTAKDGSKVVVGLCAFEGEDGFGTQNFVIRKSQKDPAALTIYSRQRRGFRRGQSLQVSGCCRSLQAGTRASRCGSSTTLSCSLGSVRAITADDGLSLLLAGRCGTPAGM